MINILLASFNASFLTFNILFLIKILHDKKKYMPMDAEDSVTLKDNKSKIYSLQERMQYVFSIHVNKIEKAIDEGKCEFFIENYILPINFYKAILGLPDNATIDKVDTATEKYGFKGRNTLASEACTRVREKLLRWISDRGYTWKEKYSNGYVITVPSNIKDITATKNIIHNWEPIVKSVNEDKYFGD